MIKGLYAITNEDLTTGELLLRKVEAALLGGCRLVQYRNKQSSADVQLSEARALLALCREHEAALIINDSLPLAESSGAHGVHLGQEDEGVEVARMRLGPNAIIGATCHASLELAQAACAAGASYLAFGRFFPSQTKPEAPPAPLSLLTEVERHLPLPTVAIGGINMDNAAGLIAAGADCLAVSHNLFQGEDLGQIRERATYFTSLFKPSQEPQ